MILNDFTENSGLLKIKLEDSENEVKSLKKQLTDFHTYKDQYDSLTGKLVHKSIIYLLFKP